MLKIGNTFNQLFEKQILRSLIVGDLFPRQKQLLFLSAFFLFRSLSKVKQQF